MEIKSSIILRGEAWHNVHTRMEGVFFETLFDVFKLSVAIGILYDKHLPDEVGKEEKAEVPVVIFNRYREIMSYFFKAAILTSSCVDFTEKERLYLAFSEDITLDDMDDEELNELRKGISENVINFDRVNFLKRFANYGITKLYSCLTLNESETMESLIQFLDDSYNGISDELIHLRTVEDMEDEDLDEGDSI